MPVKERESDSKIDDRYDAGHGSYGRSQEDYDKEAADIWNHNFPDGDPGGELDKLNASQPKSSSGWKDNTNKFASTSNSASRTAQAAQIAKVALSGNKAKAAVSLLSVFGVTGILFFLVLSPASLFVSFADNMSITNDTSAHTMESRFARVFNKMAVNSSQSDGIACKTAKCKRGLLSNKGLNQLHKKGIVINLEDSSGKITQYDGKTKKGMPNKKVSGYSFDVDGKTKNIKAKDLKGFLAKNPKYAAKFLGTRGAFNLRVASMTGKFINTRFLSKFGGIDKSGALARALSKPFKSAAARVKGVATAIKKRIPGLDKMSSKMSNVGAKWEGKVKAKGGKGGIVYAGALAVCIASKAPTIIAAAAVGVELANLLQLISPILSSASLAKAAPMWSADEDSEAEFTPEAAENIGSYLTETDSNGRSAMDSKYLLAALGVNTALLPFSKKYAPGYSALNSAWIAGGRQAENLLKTPCAVMMGPMGMAVGMAISSSGGPATFFVSSLLGFALAPLISKAVGAVGRIATDKFVEALIDSDKFNNIAAGEDRGDALGVAAQNYFSSQSFARNIPALTESTAQEFAVTKQQNFEEEKQRDIASLSPLDISSRFTLMGSVVNNMRLAMIVNGGMNSNIFARLKAFSKIPMTFSSLAFSGNSVSAAAFADAQNCRYAHLMGIAGDDKSSTPALNASGALCTGMSDSQISMDPSAAVEALEERGWIDLENTEVSDDLGVEEYIDAIKVEDTPFALVWESCHDTEEGDHLVEAGGCIVQPNDIRLGQVEAGAEIIEAANIATEDGGTSNGLLDGYKDEDGNNIENISIVEIGQGAKYTDAQAINAISVFIIDTQMEWGVINGNDKYEAVQSATMSTGTDINMEDIYKDSTNIPCGEGTTEVRNDTAYNQGTPIPIKLCSIDIASSGTYVNSRTSAASAALMKKMKEDLKIDGKVQINDSFRTMAEQIQVRNDYGAQAAPPGYSNHQMGLAFDFNMGGAYGWSECSYTRGVGTCSSSKVWNWLKENASGFGFKQLSDEYWHWSPVEDTEYSKVYSA